MKFYPIVIPTLNRYKHLRRCIESLAKCKYADRSELVIGLDYPSKESHFDGYNCIKSYLPLIKGFRKITIFERKQNFGAIKNLQELIGYVYQTNSAAILSEDDNLFAPTFLEFINSALSEFESDENVSSVCGFTPESQYDTSIDYLMSPDASAWGMARWKNKDFFFTHDRESYANDILTSFDNSFKIYRVYPACLAMLLEMKAKGDVYGDTVRTAYNIIENKYQIKPSISLVRNLGQDGSGLHSGSASKEFENQPLSDRHEYYINGLSTHKNCNYLGLLFHSLSRSRLKAMCSIILIGLRYIIFRVRSHT